MVRVQHLPLGVEVLGQSYPLADVVGEGEDDLAGARRGSRWHLDVDASAGQGQLRRHDRVVAVPQRHGHAVDAALGDLIDQQAPALGGQRRHEQIPEDQAPGTLVQPQLVGCGGVGVLDAAVGGVEDPDPVVEVVDERHDEFTRGCQHADRTSRCPGSPARPERVSEPTFARCVVGGCAATGPTGARR